MAIVEVAHLITFRRMVGGPTHVLLAAASYLAKHPLLT